MLGLLDSNRVALKKFLDLALAEQENSQALNDEEQEHAKKFIDYQTMRGGRVAFTDIAKPDKDDWGTAVEVTVLNTEQSNFTEQTSGNGVLPEHGKEADSAAS